MKILKAGNLNGFYDFNRPYKLDCGKCGCEFEAQTWEGQTVKQSDFADIVWFTCSCPQCFNKVTKLL